MRACEAGLTSENEVLAGASNLAIGWPLPSFLLGETPISICYYPNGDGSNNLNDGLQEVENKRQ